VIRLGPMILSAVLLGMPRALGGHAFGDQRSVYIDVAALPPELTDFTAELERAIGDAALALAARPSLATTVIEVERVARSRTRAGDAMEAVALLVREGTSLRRMILHYAPQRRARAAAHLLERLAA
jgi:hypothetical protein